MRILVADDDKNARDLLESILQKGGHTVTMVVNGRELLDKLGSPRGFDMVLTDNDMPEMTGLEALRRIRSIEGIMESSKQLPVIVLSARDVSREVAALSGIYINKRVDAHEKLWSTIEDIAAGIRR